MTDVTTEALIAQLSHNVRTIPASARASRLFVGLALGGIFTLIGVRALGWRPDLSVAMLGVNFWVKIGYTGALGLLGAFGVLKAGTPDMRNLPLNWLILPIVLLGTAAIYQLLGAGQTSLSTLFFGASWQVCARNIVALSAPIYAGAVWVMRKLAPTDLSVAGAATGLAAGGIASALYCFHCPETSMLFVLIWYSLGVAGSTALGAVLGPYVLRW